MAENFSIQQREQIVPLSLRGGTPFVQLQRSTISRQMTWITSSDFTFPPSHVIFGAYLVALMCGTVNLISMTILHFWFEFLHSMAHAMQYSTWLVQLESYSFCLKL